MSQAPAMPVFTDALIGDTTHLSAEEFGAYFLILCATWRNNAVPFPDDDHRLARICRMSEERWKKRIKPVLAGFFDLTGGAWRQKRLEKEWNLVIKKLEANRLNGTKGGRPKSLKEKETPKPNGSVSDNPKSTQTEPIHIHKDSSLRSESGVADATPARAPPDREIAERLAASWREVLAGTGLAMPSKLNRRRIAAAAARWGDELGRDEAQWRAFLGRIRGSPFLLGGGPRGWKADFDWALQSGSILATLEGKYDQRPAANGHAAGDEADPAWTEDDQWRTRLGRWRSHGSWLAEMWGPAPGKPGCVVPKNLLEELA